MKAIILSVIGLFFLVASQISLATISGKDLFEDCMGKQQQQSQQYSGTGFCMGYIAAFLDTYVLTSALHGINKQQYHFCLGDKGISYREAMIVVKNYFHQHRDALDESARTVLMKAFMDKYPCDRQAPQQQPDDRYQNQPKPNTSDDQITEARLK